jgi:two-component system response regulator LytT
MPYTALIVDDEELARQELRYLLDDFESVEVLDEAGDGRAAVRLVEKHDPDLVFLDIQMPEMDGFAVIRELVGRRERLPFFVLVTAYDRYALEAFEANAVDYLLKPVDRGKLSRALERLGGRVGAGEKEDERIVRLLAGLRTTRKSLQGVPVREEEGVRLVPVEEVVALERRGRRVVLLTRDSVRDTNYADLSEVETSLPPERFVRADEAHVINVDHIREIIPWSGGNHRILLDDTAGTQVPINRAQTLRLRAHLEALRRRT